MRYLYAVITGEKRCNLVIDTYRERLDKNYIPIEKEQLTQVMGGMWTGENWVMQKETKEDIVMIIAEKEAEIAEIQESIEKLRDKMAKVK